MPKKTKKQKIIAQYRKKIKLLEMHLSSSQTQVADIAKTLPLEKIVKEEKIIDLKSENKINQNLDSNNDNQLKDFFLSDFKKSLLFTFAIIALEILFYFATIRNYLKL